MAINPMFEDLRIDVTFPDKETRSVPARRVPQDSGNRYPPLPSVIEPLPMAGWRFEQTQGAGWFAFYERTE